MPWQPPVDSNAQCPPTFRLDRCPSQVAELTSAFSGHSLAEVACFLSLLYTPDLATPAALADLHIGDGGLLRALVRLAHRLDVAGLLGKCERYLQGGV